MCEQLGPNLVNCCFSVQDEREEGRPLHHRALHQLRAQCGPAHPEHPGTLDQPRSSAAVSTGWLTASFQAFRMTDNCTQTFCECLRKHFGENRIWRVDIAVSPPKEVIGWIYFLTLLCKINFSESVLEKIMWKVVGVQKVAGFWGPTTLGYTTFCVDSCCQFLQMIATIRGDVHSSVRRVDDVAVPSHTLNFLLPFNFSAKLYNLWDTSTMVSHN